MPEGQSDVPENNNPAGGFILVVEDDTRTRNLERFILEEEGFQVQEAGSGEEALQALDQVGPDLVLLDVKTPGIDGFTTCQRIRESSLVPIIMVTAEERDEDKVRGLELGADDYVTKPFSTTELAARVKAVLRRCDRTSAPSGASTALQGQDQTGEPTVADAPCVEAVSGERGTRESVDSQLYEGTVKLVVETTGNIRDMIHFVDELRKNNQMHLLRLVANQRREGMDILLRLREPIQLKSTLLEMKDVSRVDESTPASAEDAEHLLRASIG